MTNEEIKKAIAFRFDTYREMYYGNAAGDLPYLQGLIDEEVRELVSQAYEEAAQAQCRYCRYGLPVEAVAGSATNELVPLGETYYLRRADGAYIHGDMRCESHRIRALKDSLALEPVPSTAPPSPSAPASLPENQ